MKKYVKWLICLLCLFIFVVTSIKVLNESEFVLDNVFYEFMDESLIGDNMTMVMKFITWFGGTSGIILMCILSLFIFKDKKINTTIVCNLVIVTILNTLFKVIFMRARPDINHLVIETGYSFPSGHSMISMAFYGYLIYIIYTHKDNARFRWLLISLISILVLLIGISRIYLGVHYTSDVVGGFCFSIAYLIIYISIVKKIIKEI